MFPPDTHLRGALWWPQPPLLLPQQHLTLLLSGVIYLSLRPWSRGLLKLLQLWGGGGWGVGLFPKHTATTRSHSRVDSTLRTRGPPLLKAALVLWTLHRLGAHSISLPQKILLPFSTVQTR